MELQTQERKKFTLDMTIGEAMSLHPHAAHVFASFHLGGCSHCAVSEHETIEEVCYGYGVPSDVLLEALNGLLESDGEEEGEKEEAKAPTGEAR